MSITYDTTSVTVNNTSVPDPKLPTAATKYGWELISTNVLLLTNNKLQFIWTWMSRESTFE